MAPWTQIAKPFSLYFALNCFKAVVGAGFVGYGVALAVLPADDDDDNGNANGSSAAAVKPTKESESSNRIRTELIFKYVRVAATIGFGLFLSLPSLTSQIFWETMIPGITATDIAYDLGTENVLGIFPKWNLKKPNLSSLVPSKEKIVGGLRWEATAVVEDSSGKNRSSK
jgi:hypothetical protein